MTTVPTTRIELLTEQRRDVLAHETLSNLQLKGIDHRLEPGQRAQSLRGNDVVILRIVGFQNIGTIRPFGDRTEQILVVTRVVLPLNGHDAAGNGASICWAHEFKKQVVAITNWVFTAVHRVASCTGDEMARWINPTVALAQPAMFCCFAGRCPEMATGNLEIREISQLGA